MTVFVAAKGFAAHLRRSWKPVDVPLDVELSEILDGGAVISSNNSGHVPNLRGRLNPILDDFDRTFPYIESIAINGGLLQPVQLTIGEDLHFSDSEEQEAVVRVAAIVGRAALVQYRHL
ncbi:MAG: hypothetical protein OXI87_18585 [Albidovulum sp.]|nr:hypothetical protein [Albidovulum sp.]